MRLLHVAVAQVHAGGTIDQNLQRIERQIAAAAAVNAEVILFAECVLQGYDYDMTRASVRRLAVPADGAVARQLVRLARSYRIGVAAGLLERDGDAIYNSVLVAWPDGSTAVARKHNLTAGEFRAGLTRGPRAPTVVTFNGVRVAIIICADGGVRGLHPHLARAKVDYRFCPTGGGGRKADMLHEHDLRTGAGRRRYATSRSQVFNTQAILSRKHCPGTGFASANALGPVGKRTCHQGHCMIVDNQRVMRAQIPGTIVREHQQDQMIHATLRFS